MVVKKIWEMLPTGKSMTWIMMAMEPMLNVTHSGCSQEEKDDKVSRAK